MVARVVAAVRTRARAVVAAPGRAPTALLCVAALGVAVAYCANHNVDDKLGTPRDDGVYRPALARGDGHMHYLITRSLVFDRDVDFDNDLARFGDPWRQPRTATGKKLVMQQIGPSLIWAPLLAFAHGLASLANVFGADIATHGYTLFHQRIVFASSVVFAWLAIALGVLVAWRLVGGRWGPALAGVAVLLGTSLTYYATFMPSYAHAMDAAACACFLALWALTLGDLRWRRYVWLGLLLGVAAMVRVQDLGFGFVLAVELAELAWQRRSIAPLLRGVVTLAIALVLHVPQLYVWNEHFGSWLVTPQGPGQMRYGHAMVLELLFSSRNGWLSTHPIAYVGVIGLGVGCIEGARLGPRVRLVCAALLLVVIGQVYVNAITYEWWSAASFGQRRMCSSTLPILVGVAVALRWAHVRLARPAARTKLAIAFATFGYLVVWNLHWAGQLTRGRPAGRDNRASCCDDAPAGLAWLARPIYAAVGNPFGFPANVWFALRHDVDLARWDRAVGNYALVPGVLGYVDGTYRRAVAAWNALDERYLLDGWGEIERGDAKPGSPRSWRATIAPRAELLLPLLMPEPHRVTIPIKANVAPGEQLDVAIYCNGELATRVAVGAAWTSIAIVTDGAVGESTIGFELGANARDEGPSAGIAISAFQIGLP